ncbi:putative RDD family membrane protein YckC [Chitinivorax tropicus]|uniref:Putative RDD family membrane protein YckC n=1 Tax=Chitinivorax tropicus TaxID=714531 RepID=A0A840MT40_9PROT|nr:RDD family protein [Chitinivorax tropicus]MBB5018381.1 putative RDD family membrane protein YckC [Chitinivorax tropicus]
MMLSDDMPLAGTGRRLLCLVYEFVILFALSFVVLLIPMAILPLFGQQANAAAEQHWAWRLLWLMLLGVNAWYLVRSWTRGGQTLAMRAWRMRLVTLSGQPVGHKQAIIRLALGTLGYVTPLVMAIWSHAHPEGKPLLWSSLAFLAIMLGWAMLDKDRQFLHDRLAGTCIVRTPPLKK